ncbi:hypothetical protein IE81DRAFT_199904 [Ceraceosorus guamensis]|uniref:Uncharacterized protein n=1 Tax=Ceraceosorus guamensis TaxID=1522189 RepID=A0A316VTK2_9BASI|nr:hypothetical protein IE81DRAFT_199904 [Ceraceosorus guamensis]PWN40926.1 hypothetical protein IE81DRAFT_199904 [Ceraceosorus guamensis]
MVGLRCTALISDLPALCSHSLTSHNCIPASSSPHHVPAVTALELLLVANRQTLSRHDGCSSPDALLRQCLSNLNPHIAWAEAVQSTHRDS